MARVALVTGGSRGIGAAISKALKDAGYSVAASYAGNDAAAAAFTAETGIKTYKWNVGSYEDSAAGIAQVEADLGPIDVVVANAGITMTGSVGTVTQTSRDELYYYSVEGSSISSKSSYLECWDKVQGES